MTQGAPHHGRVFDRGYDNRRQGGVILTQPRERRKPADAGHVEVEQQEVRRAIRLDDLLQRLEAVRLDHGGAGHDFVHGVRQGVAE